MIQEFKIKNFLSFRDEITFSFEATKDTTFEDYQVIEVSPDIRLLRFALVYGANASGKSNLLNAIDFLREFWFAKQDDIDGPTGVVPFHLDIDAPSRPTEFEIKFYVDNVRYWYQLNLDKYKVYSEKLYYYKSVQPTMLFGRQLEGNQSVIRFNPAVVKVSAAAQEDITLKCLPNMSFFAARNRVNVSIPGIDEARDWMRAAMFPLIKPKTLMFEYADRKIWENEDMKTYMLDFIRKADFNITGVKTDDLKTEFEHTVKNERGVETYFLPNSLQSEGTRRIFGVEAAIYQALQKNAFISIDEIESSLHPDLVEFIIEKFLKDKSNSQLLVTSHYDPLLNTVNDLIRKDSVWFTEKNEAGSTELYSLVDFKGLNKVSSFQRSYRNGVFGALPNIKGL